MNFQDFERKYLIPFKELEFIYEPAIGFVVWRKGTGDNLELLHLRVFQQGRGHGAFLVRKAMEAVKKAPPYYSVFAFVLGSNAPAQQMFKKLGFQSAPLPQGVYKHDSALVMWTSYEALCRLFALS